MKQDRKVSLTLYYEPTVTEISADGIGAALNVKGFNHVGFYFPDFFQVVSFEVNNGKRACFWSSTPITRERAIEVARRDGKACGLTRAHNHLYIVNNGIQAFEHALDRATVDDSYDIRMDTCRKYVEAGENCLTAIYDASSREVYVYRFNDGEPLWYWAASNVTQKRAVQIAEANRRRAELPHDSLHFHCIDRFNPPPINMTATGYRRESVSNESA